MNFIDNINSIVNLIYEVRTKKQNCKAAFEQSGWYYEFSFNFVKKGDTIRGEISDEFGNATFEGPFRDDEFSYLKHYRDGRSVDCQFMYVGTYDENEKRVSGKWYSLEYPLNSGQFWIQFEEKILF